jgi:hypothetical protein
MDRIVKTRKPWTKINNIQKQEKYGQKWVNLHDQRVISPVEKTGSNGTSRE